MIKINENYLVFNSNRKGRNYLIIKDRKLFLELVKQKEKQNKNKK